MLSPSANVPTLPLVSVVTPSFQHAEFIESNLCSVLAQDYPRIEHIVVDGGSSDGTLDILRRYENAYNMRWTTGPDAGQADAIRKGFAMSSGEVLCWLNSDDVYVSTHAVSEAVAYLKYYKDVGMVCGCGVMMDRTGRWTSLVQIRGARINAHYLSRLDEVLQPATFFRRSVVDTVPLDASLHFAFDWAFFREAAQHFALLPVRDVWAGYRWWGVNKSASGGARRARELAEVTRRFLGAASWQYFVVSTFAGLHAAAERLPASLRGPSQRMVTRASIVLSDCTGGRVTPV